jgi:hypothetical protein
MVDSVRSRTPDYWSQLELVAHESVVVLPRNDCSYVSGCEELFLTWKGPADIQIELLKQPHPKY